MSRHKPMTNYAVVPANRLNGQKWNSRDWGK